MIILYIGKPGFSRQQLVLLCSLLAVVFILQSVSASHRHRISESHILAGVVLPNPKINQYFLNHGMPAALSQAGKTMQVQPLGRVKLSQLAPQVLTVNQLGTNFVRKVDKLYYSYLLLHPRYIINNTIQFHEMIFDQTFHSSNFLLSASDGAGLGAGPVYLKPSPDTLAPLLFPTNIKLSPMDYLPFSVIIVVGLGYTIYFLVFARSRRMMLPLIFMVAGVSNAILAFFGELWEPGEMARHAFVGSVLLHVGVCLAILFWADQFITARSQQPV
jgi:hypothetical protein